MLLRNNILRNQYVQVLKPSLPSPQHVVLYPSAFFSCVQPDSPFWPFSSKSPTNSFTFASWSFDTHEQCDNGNPFDFTNYSAFPHRLSCIVSASILPYSTNPKFLGSWHICSVSCTWNRGGSLRITYVVCKIKFSVVQSESFQFFVRKRNGYTRASETPDLLGSK